MRGDPLAIARVDLVCLDRRDHGSRETRGGVKRDVISSRGCPIGPVFLKVVGVVETKREQLMSKIRIENPLKTLPRWRKSTMRPSQPSVWHDCDCPQRGQQAPQFGRGWLPLEVVKQFAKRLHNFICKAQHRCRSELLHVAVDTSQTK